MKKQEYPKLVYKEGTKEYKRVSSAKEEIEALKAFGMDASKVKEPVEVVEEKEDLAEVQSVMMELTEESEAPKPRRRKVRG